MFENSELKMFREAHEARLLKRFLAEKLIRYGGITHEELQNICIMLDIGKEGETK